MSSSAGPSLAHRSVSNIRTETGGGSSLGGPLSPHTPSRTVSSTFGSPSSLRAEEDIVVIELGSRFIRLGFAGEPTPKAIISLGPEEQRRVGDYRAWDPDHQDDWRRRPRGKAWGNDHQLWQYDLRLTDLGLVEDKIDRAIREALTKYQAAATRCFLWLVAYLCYPGSSLSIRDLVGLPSSFPHLYLCRSSGLPSMFSSTVSKHQQFRSCLPR